MKKTIRIVLIALAAALLLGIAALAVDAATSAGSEDDPLVTLSYINDVFVPYVTSLFREDLEEKEAALQEALEERVSSLEGAGVGGGTGSREYVVRIIRCLISGRYVQRTVLLRFRLMSWYLACCLQWEPVLIRLFFLNRILSAELRRAVLLKRMQWTVFITRHLSTLNDSAV